MDFQLHEGLAPLTSILFKGPLYIHKYLEFNVMIHILI